MAQRRARRTFARQSVRAPTNWARSLAVAVTNLPASTKIIASSIILSNPGIGETIRRTRGKLLITSDQTATSEVHLGAMGMMVVSDVALALGITAVPDPVTEADDDNWFVWEPFLALSDVRSGESAPNTYHAGFEFDSKAMRRVEEGSAVVVVIANASAVFGLEFALSFSMLSSRTA